MQPSSTRSFPKEQFKPITSYPDYLISTHGRIFNTTTNNFINPRSPITNGVTTQRISIIPTMIEEFHPDFINQYLTNNVMVCVDYPESDRIIITKLFDITNATIDDYIKELFYYKDGNIYAKYNIIFKGTNIKQHDLIGCTHSNGYKIIHFKAKQYQLHRLIFKLHNPDIDISGYFIDHINKDITDNNINNLRLATIRENSLNCTRANRISTTSPELQKRTGVRQRGNRFNAYIKINKKQLNLGYFDTAEEAYIAYLDAYKQYNQSIKDFWPTWVINDLTNRNML